MSDQAPGILIVDDSPLLARQLQQEVAALGLAAQVLTDPSALPAAAASAAAVFIEIQLLDTNGFALARQLGDGACKVVLVSGSGRRTDLRWGLRAGAEQVLTRPLRRGELRQALAGCGLLPPAATGAQ